MPHYMDATGSSAQHSSPTSGGHHDDISVEAHQVSLNYLTHASVAGGAEDARMNSDFASSLRGASRASATKNLNKMFTAGRPSPANLTQRNIMPTTDPYKAKLAQTGKSLEKRRKQQELTARLLMRPERHEVHSKGILLADGQNAACGITKTQTNEEQVASYSRGLRGSANEGTTAFNVKIVGTKSKSQLERESSNVRDDHVAVAPAQVAHARRRLSNHFITRPKLADLQQKNIVPSYFDEKSGSEFYVFSTEDLNSPGKPLAVKQAKGPGRVESLKFMKRKEVLKENLKKAQAKKRESKGSGVFYN